VLILALSFAALYFDGVELHGPFVFSSPIPIGDALLAKDFVVPAGAPLIIAPANSLGEAPCVRVKVLVSELFPLIDSKGDENLSSARLPTSASESRNDSFVDLELDESLDPRLVSLLLVPSGILEHTAFRAISTVYHRLEVPLRSRG
jgi:hypothetical protein